MQSTVCKITIFEGPDGGGKTTAAKKYAEDTGARYVHFSQLKYVAGNLGRFYVEAMMPALLGYQDVVFDRCWISEIPYSAVFREGVERLNGASYRMLSRLAMRCGGVVILCRPEWYYVRDSYLRRKQFEMLDNLGQLRDVYDFYGNLDFTSLPIIGYDYTTSNNTAIAESYIDSWRMPLHPKSMVSVGNLEAPLVIVGDSFSEQKDNDPLHKYPFVSFSDTGCSQWFTNQLRVHENQLLWVSSNQELAESVEFLKHVQRKFITFDESTKTKLCGLGVESVSAKHPRIMKRFNGEDGKDYYSYLILR